MGGTSDEALAAALAASEPVRIARSYQSMSAGKDLGTVDVLLTPPAITRRSLAGIWYIGRPKFSLGRDDERLGRSLAPGIAAGPEAYPDLCATCLEPSTRAFVYETTAALLPGGSGRFTTQVGTLRWMVSFFNRPYRRQLIQPLVAANWQRVWHAVPFCDRHGERTRDVGFGTTALDRAWVSFKNPEYADAFGELNALQARSNVQRWWLLLILLSLALVVLGVFGVLSYWGIATNAEPEVGDLIVGLVLAAAGVTMITWVYRTTFAPRRAARGTPDNRPSDRPSPQSVDGHRRREDGYCGHCYEPWPCSSARP